MHAAVERPAFNAQHFSVARNRASRAAGAGEQHEGQARRSPTEHQQAFLGLGVR